MEPCNVWGGYRNPQGYGRRWKEGRMWLAHRWAYKEAYGVDPANYFVLHRCDNPPCVEPTHLFLGTHKDNMKDMSSKGRARNVEASRTECIRGHPFDKENTIIKKTGYRGCRECTYVRNRAYKARRRQDRDV